MNLQEAIEEHRYKNWLLSLGVVEEVDFDLVLESSKLLLLRLVDNIVPGSINWKKIDLNPTNRY